MDKSLNGALWNQFGASIGMLINVISSCPDEYYSAQNRFYYIAYHSALFLDYYLTWPPQDFSPILPFTQTPAEESPLDSIGDLIPSRIFSKQELIGYLERSRDKCKNLIENLTSDRMSERFTEGDEPSDMDYPILEILLYNMRHTQHHIGQLNMLVRQHLNKHMEWSFQAGDINFDLPTT